MMQRVLEKLRQLPEQLEYEVLEQSLETRESFWIRNQLDQARANVVTHLSLTLYVPLESGSVGIATARVPASAEDAELDAFLAELVAAAKLATNPAFDSLPGARNTPSDRSIQEDLCERMETISQAFASAKLPEGTRLNSHELFVFQEQTHRVHSSGTDVWDARVWAEVEFVVDARSGDESVEIYDSHRGSDWTKEQIHSWIASAAHQAQDRLLAQKTNIQGQVCVVLSACHAQNLYEWMIDQTQASAQYLHIASYQKGEWLQKPGEPADSITITGVRYLPGSPVNQKYDEEGREIQDRVLWKDGQLVHYMGNSRFCSYIGETGSYQPRQFEITGGTHTREQLFAAPCLEVQQFSDFSVDETTGDYAGEIRLAYWWDEQGNRKIFTGGSVSGNLRDSLDSWMMDREEVVYGSMKLPQYTRLSDATVVAAEG